MTVQEFIYQVSGANNEHTLEDVECNCALCKKKITQGIKTKKITSGNFTNHDVVSGNYLCEACANIMKSELSTRLRRSSFIAFKDKIIYFKQADIASWIFKDKETPFVIGITFSYKKHNAFRCIINYSNDDFFIRQEEKLIKIEKEIAKKLFKAMMRLYLTYFTKDNIKSGKYNIALINKYGVEKFNELEQILSQHRKTDMFDLLVEALPSKLKQEYSKKIKKYEKEKKDAIKKAGKRSSNVAVPDLEQRGLF